MRSSAAAEVPWESIFAGYDVRGRYPDRLGPAVAFRLGRALRRSLGRSFLLGQDTRRESRAVAKSLMAGLLASGARIESLGIVPTPMVAFSAAEEHRYGLAVTPSHNAAGYAGLKVFTPSGRILDREWKRVGDAYRDLSSTEAGRPLSAARSRARPVVDPAARRSSERRYVAHLTRGLRSHLSVVVDTRGGATARLAPLALARMGARVATLSQGFSPDFFGRSPEPRPETLRDLSRRVVRTNASLGFAFDGDGDRCVVVDDRGRIVEPEMVGLLLHEQLSRPRGPIVASEDASRILERTARTVRSRVGGRYVTRRMEEAGAAVGIEPSGHFYARRFGSDSDGILAACLVTHAVSLSGTRPSDRFRRFGTIARGTFTVDFASSDDARRAFRSLVHRHGTRAIRGLEGVTFEFPQGWCLVRPSNTQPSVRFSFEATDASRLPLLRRAVRALAASWGVLSHASILEGPPGASARGARNRIPPLGLRSAFPDTVRGSADRRSRR